MGQYYKPTILSSTNDKTIVEAYVYSHDYGNGLKLMEHSYIGNNFVRAFESLILNNPKRVVWAGDYADDCEGLENNVYNRGTDNLEVRPKPTPKESRYIVNHTKNQFVDKNKVIKTNGMRVHPLPLLTCEGNGRGGGDYGLKNENIGIWARDIISVETKKPIGFTELIPNFLMD